MSYEFTDLTYLFSPRSIAIVGASDRPGSIGAHTLANVTEHSAKNATIWLVNPKKTEITGMPCYPDVASLPGVPDVLLIVVPAGGVLEAVTQGAVRGAKFAVILTSGFSEADEWGKAEETRLTELARRTGIRIYGPNCPGLVNVNARLGMTFSPAFRRDLRPGPIALATQGGGLGRALMQGMDRGAGIAMWSSSGNECDLQVADFIHHMANEPEVKVICTLIEGIKDGARFAAALQHAARQGKPVVGVKVGRSEYGARAAISHTASLTGSAEVNSAVFAQLGMIEVDDLDEILDVATLLARRMPRVREDVAVFASSGGAASLCADNVGLCGLTLAEFAPGTIAAMKAVLPEYAAFGNPVDTTSVTISNPDAFLNSLLPVAEDPAVGVVVIPIAMDYGAISANAARLIVEAQGRTDTPICPIWISDRLGEGYDILQKAGITPFRSLRNMGKALRRWADYGKWRAGNDPFWTPALLNASLRTRGDQQRTLSELDSKAALTAAGVPVAQAKLARTAQEATQIAGSAAGLWAMKIVSPDIAHKTEAGGVRLNVSAGEAAEEYESILSTVSRRNPAAVLQGVLLEPMAPEGGIEVLVGVTTDEVFGHVLTLGLGGIHVEVLRDATRRILPLTPAEALKMTAELRASALFQGARGAPPADVDALVSLMVAVSDYTLSNAAEIREIDLNPVWVGAQGQGALALDAVIVVQQ